MQRYELTEAAQADLAEIAAYTEQRWGKAQVAKYIGTLELRLTELAQRPHLGRKRDELGSGLLSTPFQSHVIYYAAVDFGVSVVRVLHQRQEPRRHLR